MAVWLSLQGAPAVANSRGPTKPQASLAMWPPLQEAPAWVGILEPTRATWPPISMATQYPAPEAPAWAVISEHLDPWFLAAPA